MNLTVLQERLAFLQGEKQQFHQQLSTIAANISAYNGAISECEHWIKLIEEVEKSAQVTE